MRAAFAFLAACLILLSLTRGAEASAAVPCEPPPSEMLLHYEGDSDEVPNCPESGTAHHHHANCGAHQQAAAEAAPAPPLFSTSRTILAIVQDVLPAGLTPASEPKPPRA
jgi:hypothetical protein